MPPSLDWDDLRVFLAVHRAGSLAKAARLLSIDPSTVGRRLTDFETALGVRLFERTPRGPLPTAAAKQLLEPAEAAERAFVQLRDRANADPLEGTVRLATTVVCARRLLRHAGAFTRSFPRIHLDIVFGRESASVATGEADVALRLKRTGDTLISNPTSVVRNVAKLTFAAYAAAHTPTPAKTAKWTGVRYVQAPWEPGREWMERHTQPSPLRLGDMTQMLDAVVGGLGVAVLLDVLAASEGSAVRRVSPTLETVNLWTVTRPENRRLARIRAVLDWLGDIDWSDESPPE